MTKSRLFLHIGHPKTGTTSIQNFLLANRTALRKDGILYPDAGRIRAPRSSPIHAAHYGLSTAYYRHRGLPDGSERRYQRLRRELAASACRTAVISCEDLIWEKPARFVRFLDRFDLTVIYYIRRQDEAVESAYAQRIQSDLHRECLPLEALWPGLVRRYHRLLAPYAETFGRDSIRLRPFEPARFPNGLLADFIALIGAPENLAATEPPRRNAALKRPYLAFLRQLNVLPLLAAEHRRLREELRALSDADPAPYPRHLLDAATRRRILAECADDHAALMRDYRSGSPGPLFAAPPPDDADFAPLHPPAPPVQQAILGRLSPGLQRLLARLHPPARSRSPADPLLPDLPVTPEAGAAAAADRADRIRLRERAFPRRLLTRCLAPIRRFRGEYP